MKVRVADLDCIYLTYDEPQKEEFWVKIKNMIPWALRVDGVKGSDAAHKAAAAASTTDRFILIDGDNLPDESFIDEVMDIDETMADCVFRWKARNNINGLVYGNGGVSCWTKHINNMRTHENSDGRNETVVEFCFDPKYLPMYNCYSTTYPNVTPFQAWRAGFREGVKMCLDRGRRVGVNEFIEMNKHQNLENLSIWHNVGADVENGISAIAGARIGTYMVMLMPDWDYKQVQDFDSIKAIYEKAKDRDYQLVGRSLKDKLGLPIVDYTAEQSEFFKKFYSRLHKNRNIMDKQ